MNHPTLLAKNGKLYCSEHGNAQTMQSYLPAYGEECVRCVKKRVELRNRHRNSVCVGCRSNYYNFPKLPDGVNVELYEDYGCWFLTRISRGKCPQYG